MIIIETTQEQYYTIDKTIKSVDRLNELVKITTELFDKNLNYNTLKVKKDYITTNLDWHDNIPPYILPNIPYSNSNLLGCIFLFFDNFDLAFSMLEQDADLYKHISIIYHIKTGAMLEKDIVKFIKTTSLHNQCIVHHFGHLDDNLSFLELKKLYLQTIDSTKDIEKKVFTAKYYLQLLDPYKEYDESIALIKELKKNTISTDAKISLDIAFATALRGKINFPYDSTKLSQIIESLKGPIAYFESKEMMTQAGLLLLDISEVENLKMDFTEAKKHIDMAIYHFNNEEHKEFVAEALRQKAKILHQWSKHGKPQYFQSSINALQNAIKIYNKEDYPQEFADIHLHLAILYADMQGSHEEKTLWSAFCASSFNNVLLFYSKKEYPYDYAMVCHNYATALIKFPTQKQQANLKKAKQLFEEALELRTPSDFPYERAITLVNQLQLYWLLDHDKDYIQEKYITMKSKIKEIKKLTDDEAILKSLNTHEEQLKQLKSIL